MSRIVSLVLFALLVAALSFVAGTYYERGTSARSGLGQTSAVFSRSATLSGDVFLTMKSGDVKRAAGIEVVVISSTADFNSAWSDLAGQFKQEYDAAVTSTNRLAKEAERLNKIYFDDIMNEGKRAASYAARDKAFAAGNRRERIVADFQERAVRVLQKHILRAQRTDVNGRYEFSSIAPGRYHVYAEYRVFNNHPHWIATVELQGGSNERLDLSNSNVGWPFEG